VTHQFTEGKELRKVVEEIDNYKRFRALVKEMIEVNEKLCERAFSVLAQGTIAYPVPFWRPVAALALHVDSAGAGRPLHPRSAASHKVVPWPQTFRAAQPSIECKGPCRPRGSSP